MGIHRFIRALLRGEPITVHGDGHQSRDFTYVADIVTANVRAAERISAIAGSVFNIGGGSRITVQELLSLLGELSGCTPRVRYGPAQPGDVDHTAADCSRAAAALEFVPSYTLRDGLARQVVWQRDLDERHRRVSLVPQPAPRAALARTAQRLPRPTPRILLYSHDTFGLGHLRRNLAIAGRLAQTFPDGSLLLLSGSPVAQQFALPPGADIVKLPSVTKVGHEHYVAHGLAVSPGEILALRRGLILETVTTFKPDLLLVDHAPLGMRGELRPALEYVRANLPQARTVLGLRDILDEPAVVRATWREQEVYGALETLYDRLVIYGVPEVCDPVAAYALPPAVAERTRFCGYIRRDDPLIPPAEVRRALALSTGEQFVLVTAGGGGDGMPVEETYVQGLLLRPAAWTSVLVTGPFMPDVERTRLETLCRGVPSVLLSHFERDLPSLMRAADLVVTMGGYNSLCEVTGSGTHAIVIPRTTPRTEQLLRAQAFARLGLVDLLLPDEATPAGLRDAVEGALARCGARRDARRAAAHPSAGAPVLRNGLDRLMPLLTALLPQLEVDLPAEEGVLV
jgi:predicted glycosyltransferase